MNSSSIDRVSKSHSTHTHTHRLLEVIRRVISLTQKNIFGGNDPEQKMMKITPRLLLLLMTSIAFVCVLKPVVHAQEDDESVNDLLAVRSPQIDALKKTIDGMYLEDAANGALPFWNSTSGHWEIFTFDIEGRGQSLPYLTHFRTLEEPSSQYVVKDIIDRAEWEEKGVIVPYKIPDDEDVDDDDFAPAPEADESSRIPISSQTVCLWSLGGSDMASTFLRCANAVRTTIFTSISSSSRMCVQLRNMRND